MDDFEQLDHYSILGVSRSATADELKRAYRQQMARFHPDRFAGASLAEQQYAGRRAQRINEAYAVLSDFGGRNAYNRTLAPEGRTSSGPATRTPPPAPAPPRDHMAELYDQARVHLEAGRALQAVATLRELQQLNPFYKDSAALLAKAEAAANRPHPPAPADGPDRGRRAIVAGGLGAVVLLGLGAAGWALRGRPAAATLGPPTAAAGAGGLVEPEVASAPPASTGGATIAPAATQPAATQTAAPTSAPTATPQPAPTAAATAAPTASPAPPPVSPTPAPLAEEGQLLYADSLGAGRGWPTLGGRGWNVGFVGGGYQIAAINGAGNIWAFGTSPAGEEFLVGVDVVAVGGVAGLLLRHGPAGFLAFMVDPALGSYRLERRLGGRNSLLIEEGNGAIAVGPDVGNRLVARLEGLNLSLRINGQPVYEVAVDSPPPSDQYGMVAAARGADEVVATFSNLAVRAL